MVRRRKERICAVVGVRAFTRSTCGARVGQIFIKVGADLANMTDLVRDAGGTITKYYKQSELGRCSPRVRVPLMSFGA